MIPAALQKDALQKKKYTFIVRLTLKVNNLDSKLFEFWTENFLKSYFSLFSMSFLLLRKSCSISSSLNSPSEM